MLAILFMGIGLYVLQRTAKSLPQLFQAMGLMLYVAQLLLLLIFVGVFKDTSLFNPGRSRPRSSSRRSSGWPPRPART